MPIEDVKTAFEAIRAKDSPYTTLWSYYDGNQPLVYSTERLADVFKNINAHFEENWCAVVVDSVLDRLAFSGWRVADDDATTKRLTELDKLTGLNRDRGQVHESLLVVGEAFVIVWPDAEGALQAFYNDARMCHVEYDAENPRKVLWAAKLWTDKNKLYHLTLYYPDHLEYYVTDKKADQVDGYQAFREAETARAGNPYGETPVFHLRREMRTISSEMLNAIGPQDAINKLLADMMVAAEFGAFRQRWIISNSDTGQLKNSPNEIWTIPASDGQGQPSSVGEFGETDLSNYLDAIDRLAKALAAITRTPQHYFFGSAGDPSGEALIAMESPLCKKAQRHIDNIKMGWEAIGKFMLKAGLGLEAGGEVEAMYEATETVQPRTQAEIRKLNVDAGIPLTTVLKEEGWDEDELAEMEKDKRAEREQTRASLGQAMMEAQRQFDAGEMTDGGGATGNGRED